MRNTMRKLAAALAAGALIFSAGAFAKDGHIKVGVITGPEFQIAETVKQIAKDLGVSEPRVYQLISRAKAIGREYRKERYIK